MTRREQQTIRAQNAEVRARLSAPGYRDACQRFERLRRRGPDGRFISKARAA
jgi:hypothetical protein